MDPEKTVFWLALEEAVREDARAKFKAFLESPPLYQKHELEYLPNTFSQIKPSVLRLYCLVCKTEQPFRGAQRATFRIHPEAIPLGSGRSNNPEHDDLASRVYSVAKQCTGCEDVPYEFMRWVEVNVEKRWARKGGQISPWTKQIDRTFKKALVLCHSLVEQ